PVERKRLRHRRHHKRLRNRLPFPDRERLVHIRFMKTLRRNEQVSRNGLHRIEHADGADAAVADLARHHLAARDVKVFVCTRGAIAVVAHPDDAPWEAKISETLREKDTPETAADVRSSRM